MKKRFFSFLCVVVLIVSMVQPFAIFAADDVLVLNGLTRSDGSFSFDVTINDTSILPDTASLFVAIYDDKGSLIGVEAKALEGDANENVLILENSAIASYKLMLLSGENNIKPLCKAVNGNVTIDDIPYVEVEVDADYINMVELLTVLNVINVHNLENAKPNYNITRAEFVAVLCRAMGQERNAEIFKGETAFSDVPASHWASGYINLIHESGILNGYEDGTFAPDVKIEYKDAIKVAVCALGYAPLANSQGGYPLGYFTVANDYGITEGIIPSSSVPASTFVKLVYNMMTTPKMQQIGTGDNAEWIILDGKGDKDYVTFLTNMNVYIASGVVGQKDISDDTVSFGIRESSEDYEFGYYYDGVTKRDGYNSVYDGSSFDLILNINGSDICEHTAEYVDVYVKKDLRGNYSIIDYNLSSVGNAITIFSDDIKGVDRANKTLEYYVDGTLKTKKIKVNSTTIPYSYNRQPATTIALSDLTSLADDTELKFVEQNGDTLFDMIIATKYADARVTGVEEDRIKLDTRWVDIDYTADIDYIFVDINGKKLKLFDFEVGDVVAIVANNYSYNDATYLKIIKLTDNNIEGVVTEMATQGGKNYVWIDGVKYEDCYGLKQEAEGIFYISMTGKIFDFEGTSSIGNYAYVLEAAQDTAGSFSNNRWELKLLTVDGVAEYTLTEEASRDFEINKYDSAGNQYGYTYSLYDLIGVESSKWIWGGGTGSTDSSDNLKDANRLVAYRTNSKGEIKSLELIEIDDTDAAVKTITAGGDEYNSKTQKLDGFTVEEDTVIFDVTGTEAESAYATDISYLVDDSKYDGIVVTVDKEVKLVVITDGETKNEVIEEEEITTPQGYAYILEAAKTSISSFSSNRWALKLLTTNGGVVEYTLTEDASYMFETNCYDSNGNQYGGYYTHSLYDLIGVESSKWIWGGGTGATDSSDNLKNVHRLITYKTNSKGEIASLELVEVDDVDAKVNAVARDEYNAETQMIDGNIFPDDLIIFDVTQASADDTCVSDINCLIDGNAYSGLIINVDTEAKLFVVTEGETRNEVIEEEEITTPQGYAYILEAAQNTAGTFSNNRWELKLLTVDGVAEYTLSEESSRDFEVKNYNASNQRVTTGGTKSLYDIIGVESLKWIWGGGTGATDSSDNLKDANRLVAYRTNSKGEIKSLELVGVDNPDARVKTVWRDEYNAETQKLDGNLIEDDVVIYDITGYDSDDAYAADISYLKNECEYEGLVVEVNGKVKLLVITDAEIKLSNDTGFAIVTEVWYSTIDGEDVVIVDYIQDMAEGQITFDDNSSLFKNSSNGRNFEDLDVGDVIMFDANSKGVVRNYAILATISADQPVLNINALGQFDEKNEFIYGYIASEDGGVSTKYENVTVGFGADHNYAEISVGQETNTYSYFGTKRGVEIKDQYITEDADWYLDGATDAKDEATFFFARLVDESLVDIYTFNDRVVGRTNIEAVEAIWVTCTNWAGSPNVITSTVLAEQAVADAVVAEFDALPVVIATADDKKAVVDARADYTALTRIQKELIDPADLQKLTDAEALVATYDAAQAAAVDILIMSLPTADTIDLTDEETIVAARAAFDALDDDQKALVTTLATLELAEMRIFELRNWWYN